MALQQRACVFGEARRMVVMRLLGVSAAVLVPGGQMSLLGFLQKSRQSLAAQASFDENGGDFFAQLRRGDLGMPAEMRVNELRGLSHRMRETFQETLGCWPFCCFHSPSHSRPEARSATHIWHSGSDQLLLGLATQSHGRADAVQDSLARSARATAAKHSSAAASTSAGGHTESRCAVARTTRAA